MLLIEFILSQFRDLINGLFPVYLVPLGIILGIGILMFVNANNSFMAQIETKRNFYKALNQIRKYNQANLSVIGQQFRKQKFGK